MLYLNIQRIATLRGISNTFTWLVKNGFSRNVANRLVNRQILNIKLEQIQQLCLVFRCTPNDLLEWQPGNQDRSQANDPLIALIHPPTSQLFNYLNSISIEEVSMLHEKIRRKEI